MTIELYPEIDAIEVGSVMRERGDKYGIVNDVEFVFDIPKKFEDTDILFMRDGYSMIASHGLVRVAIDKGMIVDGVTNFPDFNCLLIWSVIHDICCWCSQETKNTLFEEIGDEVCSEICKTQGAGFVLRNTVEIAVENYNSHKNDPTYHN